MVLRRQRGAPRQGYSRVGGHFRRRRQRCRGGKRSLRRPCNGHSSFVLCQHFPVPLLRGFASLPLRLPPLPFFPLLLPFLPLPLAFHPLPFSSSFSLFFLFFF